MGANPVFTTGILGTKLGNGLMEAERIRNNQHLG